MATPAITAVLKVFFSKSSSGNTILQSFPSDDFVAPPKAISQITYQAVASPSGTFTQAPVFTGAWVEGSTQGYVTITGPFPASTFVATIDNTTVASFDATIKYQSQIGSGPNPLTVTGSGTIRNKGTSIWAIYKNEFMVVSLVSLVIGAVIFAIFERLSAAAR